MLVACSLFVFSHCAERSEPKRPNVLLISVDTLRADRLGGYGYERPTSPRIDQFLAEAIVFDDAHVHAPWTMPSLASWLTGLTPGVHGVAGIDSRLSDEFETLPEMLRAEGYRTLGILAQVFLERKYGLTQGIDELELLLRAEDDPDGRRPLDRATSQDVAERAIAAFERLRDGPRPWAMWLHLFGPHEAYIVVHPGIGDAFGSRTPSDRYDGEVRYTDHYVGQVLDALEHYGYAKDTIVVFFSDHGEEFGEHGGIGHGQSLHEELIRIPFAIRVPGVAPRRVSEPVAAIDLVPTLLESVGSRRRSFGDGRSLAPSFRGERLPIEPIFLAVAKERFFDGLEFGRHKLIVEQLDGRDVSFALFDRVDDPHERKDLAPARPETLAKMRELLETSRARARTRANDHGARVELSDSDRELMRQLGYLK